MCQRFFLCFAPGDLYARTIGLQVPSYVNHLVQDDLIDPVADVVHRTGLACRLGRFFCLRQRCPPDTRTPKFLRFSEYLS